MPPHHKSNKHPAPRSGDPESFTSKEGRYGSISRSDLDEFPHAVSHALLMGMDDGKETLPSLAARLDITLEQALRCLETTGKRISKLISTIPPTVSKPSQ